MNLQDILTFILYKRPYRETLVNRAGSTQKKYLDVDIRVKELVKIYEEVFSKMKQ